MLVDISTMLLSLTVDHELLYDKDGALLSTHSIQLYQVLMLELPEGGQKPAYTRKVAKQ